MPPIIQLENIDFNYPNSEKGIKELSLCIEKGSKTAILGLNGAGKSTLFLLLCGILKPQKGRYFLKGKEFCYTKKERNTIGTTIGYVFQDPEVQLFAPSVYEDIAFGAYNMGLDKEAVQNIVAEYLDFLGIFDLKDCAPHELSYGQKKLVAIAGVLAMQPKILILDEPFAWLDVVQTENMKQILEKLEKKGITILLSTHNLDFAYSWATHGIALKSGSCILSGKINEIKEKQDLFIR